MGRRQWQKTVKQVDHADTLDHAVWYRSPLYTHDHLLGRTTDMIRDGLAWCSRPLEDARYIPDIQVGGLFYSNRSSSRCAECKRKEEEWNKLYGKKQQT